MNPWIRRSLAGLGVVFGVVVTALGSLAFRYGAQMDETYAVMPPELEVKTSSRAVERGAHLAHIFGCRDCHGEALGGGIVLDKPPIGRIVATNLTRGKNGVADRYSTTALWSRAIRNGIRADGKPLVMMPANEFYYLSDDEIADIIAYARSVPPVDSDLPPMDVMFTAKLLDQLDFFPLNAARRIDHVAQRPDAPPAGVTVEYGHHLARGCIGCHGEGYSGGPIPGAPPDLPIPRNLTPHATGLESWTEADLMRALREGVRPDGTKINPFMPIASTKHMTDDELKAIFLFLRSLPPTPFGQR